MSALTISMLILISLALLPIIVLVAIFILIISAMVRIKNILINHHRKAEEVIQKPEQTFSDFQTIDVYYEAHDELKK
jgi:hypothetical protein